MINDGVCVESPGELRLIPYLACHVPRYHAWMSDPALLAATESDPLSLDEERENQGSWLRSTEKLTFILTVPLSRVAAALGSEVAALRRIDADADGGELSTGHDSAITITTTSAEASATSGHPSVRYAPDTAVDAFSGTTVTPRAAGAEAEPFAMVGDCNLFLLDPDELDGEAGESSLSDGEGGGSSGRGRRVFEVEVMVAEERFRRIGIAQVAVRMLMQYAIRVLGATHFIAKILESNVASIDLFTRRLGFREHKRVRVFGEIHYVRSFAEGAQEQEAWRLECGRRYLFRPFTADMRTNTMSF